MHVRGIPRLDIKGHALVKGIHLEGLRVLGRSEWYAERYYQGGADELLYIDQVASLYGRNSLLGLIQQTARKIFIPLTVAGGLRSIEDMCDVLRSGADKVALNTAAIRDRELVAKAARRFGSSAVVLSIEAIRTPGGDYGAYTDNGRERTGVDAVAWAVEGERLGAGELLVTSIDREGTGTGYDLELTRRIADLVSIPVVACGGAGGIEDLRAAAIEGHAEGVSAASIFHYHLARSYDLGPEDRDLTGNLEFLRDTEARRRGSSRVRRASISDAKAHLRSHGVGCRPPLESANA